MITFRQALAFVPIFVLAFGSRIHAFTLLSPTTARSPSSSTTAVYSTALTSEQEHAREVFKRFDPDNSGTITEGELGEMLRMLDIDANDDDAVALFKYLDGNGDGQVDFEDFLPWYSETAEAAKEVATSFQSLLIGRRTVEEFDSTPVQDDVLRRAIQCAIAAPNRSMSEPWRFIKVGHQTVRKFATLKAELGEMETEQNAMDVHVNADDVEHIPEHDVHIPPTNVVDWTEIPGWIVVTTKVSPNDPERELDDFKSVSCAVQNLMLSLWSEGIGSKWTSGPVQKTKEFADLCGVDTMQERVAGCIWYGFATGGLVNADPKRRKKTVDDVLTYLP